MPSSRAPADPDLPIPTSLPDHALEMASMLTTSLRWEALKAVVATGVSAALADPRIAGARRIFLAGSGDSHFAGLSLAPALSRWSGIDVRSLTAMEMARYQSPLLQAGDVVVSVSNSGSSARARECVSLARARDIPTIGVTGSLTGPLAQVADWVIHRPVHAVEGVDPSYSRCFLNIAEYLAVLQALAALGIGLGQANGRLDRTGAASIEAAIDRAVLGLPELAHRIDELARSVAGELVGIRGVRIVGAGPSRGTAAYSAAKFHEQMPIDGVHQDLEEWAHLEYFLTLDRGAEEVVLVLAPPGNSHDRAMEIVAGITRAGGRALLVAAGEADAPGAYATFLMPADLDEWLSPFLYHLPAQLLVLYMSRLTRPRFLPLRRADEGALIIGGTVRTDPSALA